MVAERAVDTKNKKWNHSSVCLVHSGSSGAGNWIINVTNENQLINFQIKLISLPRTVRVLESLHFFERTFVVTMCTLQHRRWCRSCVPYMYSEYGMQIIHFYVGKSRIQKLFEHSMVFIVFADWISILYLWFLAFVHKNEWMKSNDNVFGHSITVLFEIWYQIKPEQRNNDNLYSNTSCTLY